MGSQRLNARSTRRIARSTGLDVIRAWSHGDYVMSFVTADHRHGLWSKKDGSWQWDPGSLHFTSCRELFGDYEPRTGPAVRITRRARP